MDNTLRKVHPETMSAHLFPLKVFLVTLDFVIMLLTFGWIPALKKALAPKPLRTVAVTSPSHRRHAKHADKLVVTSDPSVTTIYDLLKRSFSKFPTSNAMGTRQFLGQLNPKVKKFGEVNWKTYAEIDVASHKFGAALRGVGLVPAPAKASLEKLKTPCALAIFENTCAEWMIASMGAFSQGIITTTIYATLGMDAVVEAINEGIIRGIVCNFTHVDALAKRIGEMPTLKTIVYTSDLMAPDYEFTSPKVEGVEIISFEDFTARGDVKAYPPTPPTPASTAVVMYTSGSTGKPKGVILTHSNIVAASAALQEDLDLHEGAEQYLSYLPLAHIMEFVAEYSVLSKGAKVCYADPKTLTTTGASPIGALEQYSPTIMVGVPKIWDIIKKGIEAKVAQSPTIAKFLVETAFEARTFAMKMGWDTPLFKALVFKKFSTVIGGNMKYGLSGGGPLNKEVQAFTRTCFGMPLVQGYGLTETCACATIQALDDSRPGIAGQIAGANEIKLESCPDIHDSASQPYLDTDRVDSKGNPIFGRGEVLIRGNTISLGYYCMPEKTKEEFDADGWFHTGDIGQFAEDGSLQIVDRKKNLIKLKGGEYIAVENMEMVYGNSKFVDAATGGIMCYGDGDMDRPIALMQLNIASVRKWIAKTEYNGDVPEAIKSKELNKAVLDDLNKEGQDQGLSRLEKLVAVEFVDEAWTPENGCLTAANKMNRKIVIQKFSKLFEGAKKKAIF